MTGPMGEGLPAADGVGDINGGLGALLGARRPPPPAAADPAGGWRAKAAAEKARAAAAASLFKGRSAASLPPGPLSAPRWDTAFQVSRPDEGTTGGLAFVQTTFPHITPGLFIKDGFLPLSVIGIVEDHIV